MSDIRRFCLIKKKKFKKDKKKQNNNYWVNAERVLSFDDGISADEGLVD